jgi:hypothetical protein
VEPAAHGEGYAESNYLVLLLDLKQLGVDLVDQRTLPVRLIRRSSSVIVPPCRNSVFDLRSFADR